MSGTLWELFILVVKVVGVFAFLMVSVLFIIWLERRVVALMQTRIGPNRVGPFGVLQSLADGIKLFFKEDVRPSNADKILYGLAPVIMMIPAFLAFTVIPFGFAFGGERAQLADLNVGLLFVLAMGSLQVYGIVLAGWASGSNYPLLGGIRSSASSPAGTSSSSSPCSWCSCWPASPRPTGPPSTSPRPSRSWSAATTPSTRG